MRVVPKRKPSCTMTVKICAWPMLEGTNQVFSMQRFFEEDNLFVWRQELVGLREVDVIQGDGSPHGEKTFVFWNPPIVFMPVSILNPPSRTIIICDCGKFGSSLLLLLLSLVLRTC